MGIAGKISLEGFSGIKLISGSAGISLVILIIAVLIFQTGGGNMPEVFTERSLPDLVQRSRRLLIYPKSKEVIPIANTIQMTDVRI